MGLFKRIKDKREENAMLDEEYGERTFRETSKYELWTWRRKDANMIKTLAFLAGCAISPAAVPVSLENPTGLLWAFIFTMVSGLVFGGLLLAVTYIFAHSSDEKLPLAQKMMILLLVPAAILFLRSRLHGSLFELLLGAGR